MNPPSSHNRDRLVEIYSANSAWEAEHLCEVLRQAGIAAQVVGGTLVGAAGDLPFGKDIALRIWVRLSQASIARDLIDMELERGHLDPGEIEYPDDRGGAPLALSTSDEDDSETSEQPHADSPTAISLGNQLNGLLAFAGLCVLVLGVWVAWKNARLLRQYPVAAIAQADDNRDEPAIRTSAGAADHPFDISYSYTVEGREYSFQREYSPNYARELPVRYHPEKPDRMHFGHIVPPLFCLLFSGTVGSFLLLAAWQFRPSAPDGA